MNYDETPAARIAAAAAGRATWDTEHRDGGDRTELRAEWEHEMSAWLSDPHNARVLAEQRRLAAERDASPVRFTGTWIDMPESGRPDPVLAPMIAAARAAAIPVGVSGPSGPDGEFRQMTETAQRHQEMMAGRFTVLGPG